LRHGAAAGWRLLAGAFDGGAGGRAVMPRTKDALIILGAVTGNDGAVRAGTPERRSILKWRRMIFDGRTCAGLSQSQLAALVGSKQSVIARLEDADYEANR
jgi:hypothetical protein